MFRTIFFCLALFIFFTSSAEALFSYWGCGRNCYYNYDQYGQYYGYQDLYTYPNGYSLPINCCFPYYRRCAPCYRNAPTTRKAVYAPANCKTRSVCKDNPSANCSIRTRY